jgi:hypothetical protein
MALAPIPGRGALESGQVVRVEAVAPGPNDGDNAGERWVVPNSMGAAPGGRRAIGAFHLYDVSLTKPDS